MNNDPNQAIEFQRFKAAHISLMVRRRFDDDKDGEGLVIVKRDIDEMLAAQPHLLNHLFDIWLAAKEDAKPRTAVFKRQTHVGHAWTYPDACGGAMFNSRAEAVESAEHCGFVVTNKDG
jgi:hypothetical protein